MASLMVSPVTMAKFLFRHTTISGRGSILDRRLANQQKIFATTASYLRHRYLANHSTTETLATMATAATKTETTTTPTADNNANNGDTTAAATTPEATNDDGDTTAAVSTTEAMNDNGNTTAAATPTEATNNNSNTMAAATPTETRITEDDDDDNEGNNAATTTEETLAPISINQPESAATEVEEAREQLLLDAAKHVKMAREQRALYQAHVAEAVCDATDGKLHSERSHPTIHIISSTDRHTTNPFLLLLNPREAII